MALTKYVFMARLMFAISPSDRACPSFYFSNAPSDHSGCSLLFLLLPKALDTLNYFALYKFGILFGTDPVSTVLGLPRCGEVDWDKIAVGDGSVSYDFPTGEIYGLRMKAIQAMKRVRTVDGAPMKLELVPVPVTSRADVLRAALASIRQDYNAYHQRETYSAETERERASGRADLNELHESDVF